MKLCKLEIQKIRPAVYVKAVVLLFAGLLFLGITLLSVVRFSDGNEEELVLFGSWTGILSLMTALTYVGYSIFAAVLSGKMIIGEYCGRNAAFLLTIPLRRTHLLWIKCAMVFTGTAFFAFCSNMAVMGLLYLISKGMSVAVDAGTGVFAVTALVVSLFAGVLTGLMGIIAAAAGWKKRSPVAAVVLALILDCLTANFIAAAPDHILWTMGALVLIFLIAAGGLLCTLSRGIEQMEV